MASSQRQLASLFRSLNLSSSSAAVAARTSCEAGPSTSRRLLSTTSKQDNAKHTPAKPYPFSDNAIVPGQPQFQSTKVGKKPPPAPKTIFNGVMPRVHADLRARYDPDNRLTKLFDRDSPDRIPPGSVLVVETWTSPLKTGFSSFSGVLLAIRRRGVSTSFVLRNLVVKLGVEMRFNLYSPLLKDVRVVQKAVAGKNDKSGKLRRTRRAKLYYLRDDDRRLAGIGNVIKQQRLLEEKREKELSKRRVGRR
ncbi:uncharacterized protein PFL1_04798 [Pseudozyma flocculosa PF-1]|uniref:Related to 50S ribosomal protein L19 n=2 Tax=Pseudozyma flocculosa TaxID=84751 RepID=A0A5C3F6A7_9BASI|nr:uncharacterized protein PFL1_04798 [Pseudozyma flocculosa PF-1]EPQ27660.1 hypothetical protein PFL1_04798 [Pseudozyma flocculosa PF-1]SPO39207.1 related to 50S ribosomal protein L19 [Pseudozyma flocculosa]